MSGSLPVFKRRLLRQFLVVSAVVAICAVAIWYYSTRSPAADYIPLMLMFLSAIAAIRGKSWDDSRKGFSRVTLTGFVLLALALIGLVGGIRSTQLNHTKLAEVEGIRNIAYGEIMEGISMLLFPITSSWRDPPENDIEILNRAQDTVTVDALAKTRIIPFPDRAEDIMAMVDDTRFYLISEIETRLVSKCGVPHSGFRALYKLFDFCVANGEAKIENAQKKFASYLDGKTIPLLHAILNDEFYKSRYRNLAQHEIFFYQGLREEVDDPLGSPDRTWVTLMEVTRALLPKADDDSTLSHRDGPSPWLYLGTYYFSDESDSAAYQIFIDKVGTFVRHVGAVTNLGTLISTFE